MGKFSSVQSLPFVQGAMIRDIFDPTVIWDELFFSHHVFKYFIFKLTKSPLFGNVDLLVAEELELGSA